MKTLSHTAITSFPPVHPNAGNGKRQAHSGNGNGNQVETAGDEALFLETRWKREVNLSETSGHKTAPKNELFVSTIDLARLEKVRRIANGDVISACPACREIGKDRAGDNLRVFSSGAYHCIVFGKDTEHSSRIFALVGIKSERVHDPERNRQWKVSKDAEMRDKQSRDAIAKKAKECRDALVARHAWTLADVWDSSPQSIECSLVESDPRHFLASLFPEEALLWTGELFQSGTAHASSWKLCRQWIDTSASEMIGPMVTPATWKTGTVSRAAANVTTAPFTVLDFDGFDGVSPKNPVEIEAHVAASLAIICWMWEQMHWKLAAIVHTGNKSLHAWFHTPPADVLDSLKPVASSLGMDAGLIGRPEHPCRLPGHLHVKSGNLSRVLWLQNIREVQKP
jgi:hypothetical protein